jgi:hypothetical protein
MLKVDCQSHMCGICQLVNYILGSLFLGSTPYEYVCEYLDQHTLAV